MSFLSPRWGSFARTKGRSEVNIANSTAWNTRAWKRNLTNFRYLADGTEWLDQLSWPLRWLMKRKKEEEEGREVSAQILVGLQERANQNHETNQNKSQTKGDELELSFLSSKWKHTCTPCKDEKSTEWPESCQTKAWCRHDVASASLSALFDFSFFRQTKDVHCLRCLRRWYFETYFRNYPYKSSNSNFEILSFIIWKSKSFHFFFSRVSLGGAPHTSPRKWKREQEKRVFFLRFDLERSNAKEVLKSRRLWTHSAPSR